MSSLSTEWERELASLWRLEGDINNGAYLQFICNWGHETYRYASQALKKIGALQMAKIIDQCQAIVDANWSDKPLDYPQMVKSLPKKTVRQLIDLSEKFMDYPDDIASLGMKYYVPFGADGQNG